MFSSIKSGTVYGLGSYLIDVEVNVSCGLPCFVMVGSLGNEVRESAERVRVALKNMSITIPPARISAFISVSSASPIVFGLCTAFFAIIWPVRGNYDCKQTADLV